MNSIDGKQKIFDTPNEKIVLRYLNSIKAKYEYQYANWIKKGIISDKDAFVIALNPRSIRLDNADTSPPRILQAAFPVGNEYLVINKETSKVVGRGHEHRGHIEKAPKANARPGEEKAKVETGVFTKESYKGLSGLLVSRVDAVNQSGEFFDSFQLVPNPHASVPLHGAFRLGGTYYRVAITENGYDVTPEAC